MQDINEYPKRKEVTMSRKSKALEFVHEGINISVTGRNVQITDPMKNYAIEKISKIERFSTRVVDVQVTMDIQKLVHRVDIVLKVEHIIIKASASTENMYASIDKAADKIQSQFRRYKERIKDHQAKPVEEIEMRVNVIEPMKEEEEIVEINADIEAENARVNGKKFQFHQIVEQEIRPLKYLTYDEALMKLELSGDQFLIFRNEIDRKLCVIYRRNDGNYGVIEAEG